MEFLKPYNSVQIIGTWSEYLISYNCVPKKYWYETNFQKCKYECTINGIP